MILSKRKKENMQQAKNCPYHFPPPEPIGEKLPADRFVVLGELLPHAKVSLQRHGCGIFEQPAIRNLPQRTTIYYPKFTTRQHYWPVVHEDRYAVIFPDGTKLVENHGRDLATNAILYIPDDPSSRVFRIMSEHPVGQPQQSDYQRTLEYIDLQVQSMRYVDTSFCATARHSIIMHFQKNLSQAIPKLEQCVDARLAERIVCEMYCQEIGE